MKTKTLLVILLIFLSTALASAQDDAKRDGDVSGTTTVRGKVVYEDTGNPMRRALVALVRVGGYVGPYDRVWALTTEEGDFEFEDVSFGNYFVHVDQKGIVNPDPIVDEKNPLFQKIVVNSEDPLFIDFAAKRGGSIEGRITYPDGSSAMGIEVAIKSKMSGVSVVTKTDDRGVYRFAGLKPEDYFVSISEPLLNTGNERREEGHHGSRYDVGAKIRVFYPNARTIKNATPISVQFGQESKQIDIAIPVYDFGSLSGIVTGADNNEPLKDLEVKFKRLSDDQLKGDASEFEGAHVKTDAYGKWTLNELPPGKYKILVNAQPYDPDRDEKKDQVKVKRYASTSNVVEVYANQEQELNFALNLAARVKGVVKLKLPKKQNRRQYRYGEVFLENEKKSQSLYLNLRAEKNTQIAQKEFELTDLEEDDSYEFRVRNYDGAWIEAVLVNGKKVEKLSLKPGEFVDKVEVVLSSAVGELEVKTQKDDFAGRLSLMLVDEGGRPFRVFNSFESSSRTDLKWNIKVKPGTYRLLFYESSDKSPREWIKDEGKSALGNAKTVEVKVGDKTSVTLD